MSDAEGKKEHRHRGGHLFIPAGVLLGLGAGLILGYPGQGVLIGLGLGFLATAFAGMAAAKESGTESSCCGCGSHWIFIILGIFMIVIGLGFLWAPINLWPYIFGIFLIALGIGLLVKNYRK